MKMLSMWAGLLLLGSCSGEKAAEPTSGPAAEQPEAQPEQIMLDDGEEAPKTKSQLWLEQISNRQREHAEQNSLFKTAPKTSGEEKSDG